MRNLKFANNHDKTVMLHSKTTQKLKKKENPPLANDIQSF